MKPCAGHARQSQLALGLSQGGVGVALSAAANQRAALGCSFKDGAPIHKKTPEVHSRKAAEELELRLAACSACALTPTQRGTRPGLPILTHAAVILKQS